jgi:integrase
MVMSLVNKRTGTPLSEHTIETAIALIKQAWRELAHDEEHSQYFASIRFDILGELYRCQTPREVDRRLLDVEKLLNVADAVQTPREAGVMALLLLGLRMNEIGAVRWEDISIDESGRHWVEPIGSISKSGRFWRERTKVGWKDNRAVPVCDYQKQLLDFALPEKHPYVCGDIPSSTSDVSRIFAELSERAKVTWEKGEHCKFVRHTILSVVAAEAGETIADQWGHQKHGDTMLSKVYDLRSVRAKRKGARKQLYAGGTCASDLLPWSNRKFRAVED